MKLALLADNGRDIRRVGTRTRKKRTFRRPEPTLDFPQRWIVVPTVAIQVHPPAAEPANRLLGRVAQHDFAVVLACRERTLLSVQTVAARIATGARVVFVQPEDAVPRQRLGRAHHRREAVWIATVEIPYRTAENVNRPRGLFNKAHKPIVARYRRSIRKRVEFPRIPVEKYNELLVARRLPACTRHLRNKVGHLVLQELIELNHPAALHRVEENRSVVLCLALGGRRNFGGRRVRFAALREPLAPCRERMLVIAA